MLILVEQGIGVRIDKGPLVHGPRGMAEFMHQGSSKRYTNRSCHPCKSPACELPGDSGLSDLRRVEQDSDGPP